MGLPGIQENSGKLCLKLADGSLRDLLGKPSDALAGNLPLFDASAGGLGDSGIPVTANGGIEVTEIILVHEASGKKMRLSIDENGKTSTEPVT